MMTPNKPNWPKLAFDWVRTPRFDPLAMTNDNKSVMAFNLSYLFDKKEVLREATDALLDLVDKKAISAPEVTTFPFERVADAHRAIESAKTTGKLVLVP
jgi:NADPH:quinone reductase-like Zn-dependent oxidoreductase